MENEHKVGSERFALLKQILIAFMVGVLLTGGALGALGYKQYKRFLDNCHSSITYSLLLLEDYIMGLEWINDMGGIEKLQNKVKNNFQIVDNWIQEKQWINYFLPDKYKEYRSPINTCLKIKDLSKTMENNVVLI